MEKTENPSEDVEENKFEETILMRNLPISLGYFENKQANSMINVLDDRIIYTILTNDNSKKLSAISVQNHFEVILEQPIHSFSVDTSNSWFYMEDNDTWIQNLGLSSKNRLPIEWTRMNLNLSKNANYCVVVGDSGNGKSSLIKLLTNCKDILTSDKAQSCTKGTNLYALLGKDICYIDTQGTDDTDEKSDDKKILNDIQRKMHDYQGSRTKIIWIVKQTSKANDRLRAQVSFIDKMGSKDPSKNIWDCVLLIVRSPAPHESLDDQIKGVIELCAEKGCPANHWKTGDNLIGYTNLDWIRGDREKRQKTKLLKKWEPDEDDPDHHGNGLHYYESDQIRKFVHTSLNKISSFQLLSLNYKCRNCGIIGDPDFVNDLRCHPSFERYHPGPIEPKHVGHNPTLKHCKKLESYHPNAIRTLYHPGQVAYRHKQRRELTWKGVISIGATAAVAGGITAAVGAAGAALYAGYGATAAAVAASSATVDVAAVAGTSGAVGTGVSGAVQYGTNVVGKGLTKMGMTDLGKYMCCGQDLASQGCLRYYTCCDGQYNEGCKKLGLKNRTYLCCGNALGHVGCQTRYGCCKKDKLSEGCIYECDECRGDVEQAPCGCRMKCCQTEMLVKDGPEKVDMDKTGCCQKCLQCGGDWGKPLSPHDSYWSQIGPPKAAQGCSTDATHDMRKMY